MLAKVIRCHNFRRSKLSHFKSCVLPISLSEAKSISKVFREAYFSCTYRIFFTKA